MNDFELFCYGKYLFEILENDLKAFVWWMCREEEERRALKDPSGTLLPLRCCVNR